MISPNNGKVLLGADGNPLRGASGKIVLADNLYPWRPSQSNRWFSRTAGSGGLAALWDLDWTLLPENTLPGIHAMIWPSWPFYQQIVWRFTFGDDIPWARVRKLTADVPVSRTVTGAETAVARISKAQDTETPPEGRGVRDSWTSVATPSKGLTTYTIDWVIDGVKPSFVALALFYDDETVPSGVEKDGLYIGSFVWQAVYNLES